MKRRDFLKNTLPLAATPFLINGIPMRAMANSLAATNFTCEEIADRVLVIVQMHGGNDGLNMVLPVDQYSTYQTLRPNIALPDTGTHRYIDLDTTLPVADQVGLHPEMTGIKSLYDAGYINIIQGAGYANNNQSHFKATDDWLTGSDVGSQYQDGWMGRYLDYQYIGYPNGYPNINMPDPIGLELGSTSISYGFHRDGKLSAGIALSGDPSSFNSLVTGVGGVHPTNIPNSMYGDKLQFLVDTKVNSNAYASRISSVYNAGANSPGVTYPTQYHSTAVKYQYNILGPQLQTVARLLSGGIKTKIFLVRLVGFDTHVNQVESTNSGTGWHAVLMYHLSEALKAFQDDLTALGLEDRVMTVTFSEFGRRAAENGSVGTDHGTIAPMIVMGKGVEPGIMGSNPDLSNLNGLNLQGLQFDYRQSFTTLLQDWLGSSNAALTSANFQTFETQKMAFINSNYIAGPGCYLNPFPVGMAYFTATPEENKGRVLVEWGTARESRNDFFTVERSVDGNMFEPIGEVEGAGTKNTASAYQFPDTEPIIGKSYYRLRQTDYDGSFTHSNVVEVFLKPNNNITLEVFPNPAKESTTLRYRAMPNEPTTLQVRDVQGRLMFDDYLPTSNELNEYELRVEEWNAGIYFLQLENEYQSRTMKLMVK